MHALQRLFIVIVKNQSVKKSIVSASHQVSLVIPNANASIVRMKEHLIFLVLIQRCQELRE